MTRISAGNKYWQNEAPNVTYCIWLMLPWQWQQKYPFTFYCSHHCHVNRIYIVDNTWPKSLSSHPRDNIKESNNTTSHPISGTHCQRYANIEQVNSHHRGTKLMIGLDKYAATTRLASFCHSHLFAYYHWKWPYVYIYCHYHHDYYNLERIRVMSLRKCDT